MTKQELTYILHDLRYIKLYQRRYKTTHYGDAYYWNGISKAYMNFKKRVEWSYYHWYVITFKDGRKELAYFRVYRLIEPHGGRLCRGLLFPRYWKITNHEHVKDIRLAF